VTLAGASPEPRSVTTSCFATTTRSPGLDRRVDQLPERIERNRIRDRSGVRSRTSTARVYRRWQAIDIDMAGADPSEKTLATLDARTRARSGQKPTLYYTTRGIVIGYQDSLSAKRQYTGETMELKGGYTGLSLNGRTVLEGDWCPKGHSTRSTSRSGTSRWSTW
jgi:hypothetical protein